MKKIALLFLMVGLVGFSYAQKKEKPPKVPKAKLALENGELAEAREIIDRAIVYEKTKDNTDTWFTRAQIYQAIATSENPIIGQQEAYKIAGESYRKITEIGKENDLLVLQANNNYQSVWSETLNSGYSKTQASEYDAANVIYDNVKAFAPEDTTVYFYAGYNAQQMGDIDMSLDNYKTMIDLGSTNIDVYTTVIYLLRAEKEDNEAALDFAQKARETFPDNQNLAKEVINLLILTGKVDEAKEKLASAIEAEPDNGNLYYNLAYIYDQEGDRENAAEAYKNAVEADPEYFDAYFNLAVLYYNNAAEILKDANNMDLNTYQKEGPALEAKARKEFEIALPYLEKAAELKPEDTTVLETLQTVYSQLKMNDKAEEIYNKLDAMGHYDDEGDD